MGSHKFQRVEAADVKRIKFDDERAECVCVRVVRPVGQRAGAEDLGEGRKLWQANDRLTGAINENAAPFSF